MVTSGWVINVAMWLMQHIRRSWWWKPSLDPHPAVQLSSSFVQRVVAWQLQKILHETDYLDTFQSDCRPGYRQKQPWPHLILSSDIINHFGPAAGFGTGQCNVARVQFLSLWLVPVGINKGWEVQPKAAAQWGTRGLSAAFDHKTTGWDHMIPGGEMSPIGYWCSVLGLDGGQWASAEPWWNSCEYMESWNQRFLILNPGCLPQIDAMQTLLKTKENWLQENPKHV